jgi:hypothetical protein
MEEPRLSKVCPYCFSSITTDYIFKLWPPWIQAETCPNCGKRFGWDRYGRTIKYNIYIVSNIGFAIVIGIFIYLIWG